MFTMTSGGALIVTVLLCVCETAGGAQEPDVKLSDVLRVVRVLRVMVEDLRLDNADTNVRLSTSQKQVEVLQTRLGPGEDGEDPCCCNHTLIQSLQTRLEDLEDQVQMIQTRLSTSEGRVKNLERKDSERMKEKDKLDKELDLLQSKYNNLSGRWDDLETRPTKPAEIQIRPETPEELKRRLCESDVGWTLDGDLCYYISTEEKNWVDSRHYCREKRSDLVMIKSKEKQDLVQRVVSRVGPRVWIGLIDRHAVNQQTLWKWVDGTSPTSTFWWVGQPSGDGALEMDCAYYYNAGYGIGWYNSVCSFTTRWMCERAV